MHRFLIVITAAVALPTSAFAVPCAYTGSQVAFATCLANQASDAEDLAIVNDAAIADLETVETWQPMQLVSSWVAFGAGFNPPEYYKDPHGVVHLRGLVMNGIIGANLTVLPVGYRPENKELQAAVSANVSSRIDILNDGTINIHNSTPSNAWVSLDGITFKAI